MRITRRAEQDDLPALLDLYLRLNADTPRLPDHHSQEIWTRTLSSNDVALFVSGVDQNLVATCLLITAPNLMRGGARTLYWKTLSRIGTFDGGEPRSAQHCWRPGREAATTYFSLRVAGVRIPTC